MILLGDSATSAPGLIPSLDRVHSSYIILATLGALVLLAGTLLQVGLLDILFRVIGVVVRGSLRRGFRLWERLLSWARWPLFLAVSLGFIGLGGAAAGTVPGLAVICGLAALFMGVTACLAYMYIDLERYEVERGYKAVHNPGKGQELAADLVRYGDRVGVLLLAAAAIAAIGGFALLNQGLYESVGRGWYSVGEEKASPGYADFLAYSLINLFRLVDLLDLANTYNALQFTYLRQALWPAAILLAAFKTFFIFVLLQQIFASIRQGQVLAETITDFWSPHPPIHERARNSLSMHGVGVVRPLLDSLRSVKSLTKEQRDQIPHVVTGIGPASVPVLVGYLDDPHEGVRVVAAAALGHLHARDALPALVRLRDDPSELVRQGVVEALGEIGGAGGQSARRKSWLAGRTRKSGRWFGWATGRRGRTVVADQPDGPDLAVATLRNALADPSSSVRVGAAHALGLIGPSAATAAPELAGLLADPDETVRCQAAEALGKVDGGAEVPALAKLLDDPAPAVKEAAARALGALGRAAADAVPALVALLQDREEAVRQAAADAVGRIGTLTREDTASLVEGLASPDTVVRAQTAEALGAIGGAAGAAAPALVEALTDSNDRVRAKAATALGQIGESAAGVAVSSLVRALRDKDNWVSALAAEALGEMGGGAEEAVPALVRSLGHINPLVRAHAAEALGKMGHAASTALPALEAAAADEDGGVRAHAVRALGEVAIPGESAPDRVVMTLVADADPQVRAAAVEALGKRMVAGEAAANALLSLLDDANDRVKFQAIRAIPKIVGPTPAAVEGLSRRLLEDDSAWVRECAAAALGELGPPAAAAGPALLRTAQTGEVAVREQAVRAIAMIQPPETAAAFAAGLGDASADIRKVASGGWMKAAQIPEEVIPALVEALRDPDTQVRANVAHALARLESLPHEAVPLLVECTADPSDGLRMNAALALREGAPGSAADVFQHLVEDPNSRIRLIAAEAVLARDPTDRRAAAVVVAALSEPTLRLRKVALEAVASLGTEGVVFLDALRRRANEEEDSTVRDGVLDLVSRLEGPAAGGDKTTAEEFSRLPGPA
jgi:HEAT repeat protein